MRLSLVTLFSVILTACAPTATWQGATQKRTVSITVESRNYDATNVRIYCESSHRLMYIFHRLPINQPEEHTIRLDNCGFLMYVAETAGHYKDWSDGPILVNPGDRVEITLAPHLPNSYFWVRH